VKAVVLVLGLFALLVLHLLGFWWGVTLLSAGTVLVGVGVIIGVWIDKPIQRDLGYDEGWRACNEALGFACGYAPRGRR
jgi:hypothetical protein